MTAREALEVRLAKGLRTARKAAKKTQREASDAMNVTERTIGAWERGETVPDLLEAARLAEFYGCKLSAFLPD